MLLPNEMADEQACNFVWKKKISAFCKQFELIGSIFVWNIKKEFMAKYNKNIRKICALTAKKMPREAVVLWTFFGRICLQKIDCLKLER